MSPEQIMASSMPIDPRTDIYSLGATLYELLTLSPAFAGDSRPELLRRILQEEPSPPRQLDRSIPPDLETIVLKAMAKAPGERYGSPQELADDLKRYPGGPADRGPPPGPGQAGRQVGAAAQADRRDGRRGLVLAVPALAVSNVRTWWEKRAKEAALEQKDEAVRQREAALTRSQADERRATIEAQTSGAISDLLQEDAARRPTPTAARARTTPSASCSTTSRSGWTTSSGASPRSRRPCGGRLG